MGMQQTLLTVQQEVVVAPVFSYPNFSIVQENSGDTGTATVGNTNITLPVGVSVGNHIVIIVAHTDSIGNEPTGFRVIEASEWAGSMYCFLRFVTTGSGGETSWNEGVNVSAGFVWWVAEIAGLLPMAFDVGADNGSPSDQTFRSTGTTPLTTQSNDFVIAALASVKVITPSASWSNYTNGFVERIDRSTTRAAAKNAGLSISSKLVNTKTTQETTGTPSETTPADSFIVALRLAKPPPNTSDDYFRRNYVGLLAM